MEGLPCANPSSSRKHAFARFHFPGAGSAPGRCRTGPEAARLVHNPKGPCPEPAAMARARPGAPHTGQVRRAPCPFPPFRYVVRLDFSGSFGPMQRGAVPRCRGAPNGSCITQTLGCGKTQYDPGQDQGSDLDRSCQVRRKWDDDPPATWLRTSGSSKNISSDRMITSRRSSRWRSRGTGCGCSARDDESSVSPSYLALALGKSARSLEHDRQTISARRREKVFKAARLTTILDVARRKPVCCCA